MGSAEKFNDGEPIGECARTSRPITFSILARWQVADPAYLPLGPFIVLSVQDPERDDVVIAESPLCRGVLRLAFHDIDGSYPGDSVVRMNTRHARDLWDFVQKHLTDIDCIVCQCEAGVSRSAGMALGLCEAMGLDSRWLRASCKYAPNRYVARMVVEAAHS